METTIMGLYKSYRVLGLRGIGINVWNCALVVS